MALARINFQADFVVHAADVTNEFLVKTGHRYPDIKTDKLWNTQQGHKIFYPGFAISISKRFFGSMRIHLAQPRFEIEAHDEFICELASTGWTRCELSESLVHYRQHSSNLIGYHGDSQKEKIA